MRVILKSRHDDRAQALSGEGVEVVLFSRAGTDDGASNEDAAAVWELAPDRFVAALADGVGGGPGGAEAAAMAIEAIDCAVAGHGSGPLRPSIVDAFERANRELLESRGGAGTTLVVVEIVDRKVRSYHAGDSRALLVGSRGRVKLETMPHSPTGYAVAAGLLEHDDSLVHEDRSLLSNCVGDPDMRIEIGPPVRMAPRDTLLVASDGVLDNAFRAFMIETIRKGPLIDAAETLREQASAAMRGVDPELPAHPDDATAILVRLRTSTAGSRS
ncbi:MAG: SpoIIE family protein phosphatase [Deltaproteobacteria bacterium]|jgi:serine/threonine protein phosphatase PrpC|nr:SpoIIE family protein phosphatase [Deltaproteobacteria bacterium]